MNNTLNGRLPTRRLQALLAAGALAAGMASTANATLVITSVAGGAPTGAIHENFDNLPLGSTGGVTASGIVVSFAPDGQAVQGSSPNLYAAPFLSGNNGLGFGSTSMPNQPNGLDGTTYLTAGGKSGSSAILALPGLEKYFGLLWGSVDWYNTLTFYSGPTLVGTITGTQVNTVANGNQGASGTFYVNINSGLAFDRVVAMSPTYAFEFDNVAFNKTRFDLPEPGTLGMMGLGLLAIAGLAIRRRKLSVD
ncbi:MAG: PEP-CTERM sorting domain-containing protein [Rhodanobacter sp.]|nr:MAG: PEP-CTERM sorting domain-containing protein [Rhodanobacter sp.]